MKQLTCTVKKYKLHHYEDLEGNVRHKKYSHIIYALNCQRLDKGYDFCQILGYVNHLGQYEVAESLNFEYSEVTKYGIELNERTMNDINEILKSYSYTEKDKRHKPINNITFDYDSDYNLYQFSGHIRFSSNMDFEEAKLNILSMSKTNAQLLIERYYDIDRIKPFSITKIN